MKKLFNIDLKATVFSSVLTSITFLFKGCSYLTVFLHVSTRRQENVYDNVINLIIVFRLLKGRQKQQVRR